MNVVLLHSFLSLLDNMVHFIFLFHLSEEVLAPLLLKQVFTFDCEEFCPGCSRLLIVARYVILQELAGVEVFCSFQVFAVASSMLSLPCSLQIVVVL